MADPLSLSASIIAVLTLSGTVLEYLFEIKDAPLDRARLRDDLSSAHIALSMINERLKQAERDSSILSSVQLLSSQDTPII